MWDKLRVSDLYVGHSDAVAQLIFLKCLELIGKCI